MEILYILLVLSVITRAFGEVAVRCGQPALVGELLSGIALEEFEFSLLLVVALALAVFAEALHMHFI